MDNASFNLEAIIGAKLHQMVEKHGPSRHDISIICLRVMGEIYSPEKKEWVATDEDYSFEAQAKKLVLRRGERTRRKKEAKIAEDWHDFLAFLHQANVGEYPPIKEVLKKHIVLQLLE